jgi:hypothetical protein
MDGERIDCSSLFVVRITAGADAVELKVDARSSEAPGVVCDDSDKVVGADNAVNSRS